MVASYCDAPGLFAKTVSYHKSGIKILKNLVGLSLDLSGFAKIGFIFCLPLLMDETALVEL